MSDLPRLLFCCFDVVPGPSAISRRLTEYAKGLSERFQVVVLSVKTPDHPHIERFQGARLLRVPVGNGDLAARVQAFDRAVRRQLESEDYLLVHFFDPFGGYALAERHAELGYKLVYDACAFPSMEGGPDALEGGRKLLAKVRRQELFCLMNADAVVVGNPLTRDWVSTVGVERDNVHLLPAPVDLGPYAPAVMGAPDSVPMRVVHLGSLAATHGLGVLLEGLALARKSAPVTLAIIGPSTPPARARLDEQVARLGLADAVEFQAHVAHDDVHKVLATADVGALTLDDAERNRVVGSPLSRLGEYLAAGRPVLCADLPSARQLAPEDAVTWYRPGDSASLADALVNLAHDPARRITQGVAARAAASRWDGSLVRADLVALYSTLTGKAVPRLDAHGEPVDQNEVTQMGRSLVAADSGEVTQLGARPFDGVAAREPGTNKVKVEVRDDSGTNKVRTDPALARPDSSTDASAPGERPAVMGVPLREEAPVVAGVELPPPPVMTPAEVPVIVAPLPSPSTPLPAPGSPADQIAREFSPGKDLDEPLTGPPVPTAPPLPWTGRVAQPVPPLPLPPPLPPSAGAGLPVSPPGPLEPLPDVTQPLQVARESAATALQPASEPALQPVAPPEPAPVVVPSVYVGPRLPVAPPPLPAPRPPELAGPRPPPSLAAFDEPLPFFAPLPEPVALPPAAPRAALLPEAQAVKSALPATRPPSELATAPVPNLELRAPLTPAPFPMPPQPEPPALKPPLPATRAPGELATSPLPNLELRAPPTLTPAPFAMPPLPLPPISAPPVLRPAQVVAPPVLPPLLAPVEPPPLHPPALLAPAALPLPIVAGVAEDEVLEVGDGDVQQLADDPELPPGDEAVMASDESVEAVETDASPPASAIDPWQAQLVHGYCPPGSHLFDRHVPPTTMPGRDP